MNAPVSRIETDPIGLFLPWIEDEEAALRRRLLRARNLAAAKVIACKHSRARTLYWLINTIAGDWMLSPAGLDDLRDLLAALTRMFMAAGALVELEAPDE